MSHKPFMSSWALKFNITAIVFIVLMTNSSFLYGAENSQSTINIPKWTEFETMIQNNQEEDRKTGISYIISGSLALVGGIVGENVTNDSVEKGLYTVFQTIGVASIGYGFYKWKIGNSDRQIYRTLLSTKSLSLKEKSDFLRSYYSDVKEIKKRERLIKSITHGIVAALNLYSASRQNQKSIRDGLYFLGGLNLLGALSYTFDF